MAVKLSQPIMIYKCQKKIVYMEIKRHKEIHFVPTVNWDLYLEKRLNTPHYCKIYDTIMETEDAVNSFSI